MVGSNAHWRVEWNDDVPQTAVITHRDTGVRILATRSGWTTVAYDAELIATLHAQHGVEGTELLLRKLLSEAIIVAGLLDTSEGLFPDQRVMH